MKWRECVSLNFEYEMERKICQIECEPERDEQ